MVHRHFLCQIYHRIHENMDQATPRERICRMARTVKNCQPPTMRTDQPDGNIAQDVADQFSSVFQPSDQWREPDQWKFGTFAAAWQQDGSGIWWWSQVSPQSTPPPFNILDVQMAISKSGLGKAGGMDLIPMEAFKFLQHGDDPDSQEKRILQLLFNLFEFCWWYGVLPSSWKEGRVFPLYKGKGSQAAIGNYRPITMTSVVRKLFERTILCVLLHCAGHLDIAQNGFRT